MSGAYVAKPAMPPTPDPPVADPPPGWNPNWPFPGPLPPGYVPEYTFPVTATAVIKVGQAAAVAGTAYDHATYITNEPDVAALGAAIGGEVISVSPSGASFSEGVYWNISDNITFGITKANEGQTIELTATSAIGGEIITGTASIGIYEYVYSLNLSGDSTIGIDDDESVSVTVTLRDHDTLKSDAPGAAVLTWTATINGAAIGLRFAIDASYSSSIESEYSDLGDYYGAEENIEFDLDNDDSGETVVLRVESTVYGNEINKTLDIDVQGNPEYAIYSVTFSGDDAAHEIPPGHEHAGTYEKNSYSASIYLGNSAGFTFAPYASLYLKHVSALPAPPGESWIFQNGPTTANDDFWGWYPICTPPAGGYDPDLNMPWRVGDSAEAELIIRLDVIREAYPFPWSGELIYNVNHTEDAHEWGGPGTWNYTFGVYDANDVLLEEHTKQNVGYGSFPTAITWLTFNGATGVVTVVNP